MLDFFSRIQLNWKVMVNTKTVRKKIPTPCALLEIPKYSFIVDEKYPEYHFIAIYFYYFILNTVKYLWLPKTFPDQNYEWRANYD